MNLYLKRDEMIMGQGIQEYRSRPNINAFINNFLAPRYAFTPSAIITQEKEFPDVSFYQGNISWDMMRSKTDAVIIRAGQNLWVDTKFETNYTQARAREMKRGVYWFYDDRISPGNQAALLVSLIKNDLPEMEVWADWEKSYGGSYGSLNNVVAFMQAVEAALPSVRVGMYSGYYYFRDHSNAVTNASQYNYLKQRPLWLAWYTSNPANVLIPAPWTSLLLWQRGTPVLYYGQETAEIDMNVPNMTIAQFNQRYGTTSEPEPEVHMTRYAQVAVAALNIRSTPAAISSPSNDIGDLKAGDTVISDTQSGDWWHLVDAKRNGVDVVTTDGRTVAQRTDCWAKYPGYMVETFPPVIERVPFTLNVAGFLPYEGELVVDPNA